MTNKKHSDGEWVGRGLDGIGQGLAWFGFWIMVGLCNVNKEEHLIQFSGDSDDQVVEEVVDDN